MADLSTRAIRSLYQSLHSKAGTTRGLWEEIATLMRPQRLGIQTHYSPGTDVTNRMYDSTALVAAKDWTDAVHFALMNPFMAWFALEYVLPDTDEQSPAVVDWCQDTTMAMRKHMADSNLTASANEAIADLGLFGNASLQVHRAPGQRFRLSYEALHLRDVVPLIGAHGRIQATLYKCKMSVQAMAEQFALDEWNAGDMEGLKAKIGKRAAKALERDRLHDEIELIHAVMPRPESDVVLGDNGLAEPEKRPFSSIWLTNDEESHPLKVGGYYEQPRFWARLRRRTDDPMGGGIGEVALPDVYSVNEWRRLILNAADKEVDPPMFQQGDQVLGDLDQRARGLTTVRDLNKIREIPVGSRTIAQMVGEDLRASIREIWMADEVKLPPRERVGQMTAYEVSKRIERIYQLMGAEIDRFHNELVRPMLERTFGILARAGEIPEMPEEMADLDAGGVLEFKFLGPAVRSQSGEEIAALDDHLGYTLQVAEAQPDVLDSIDVDAHLRKRAELIGYPMDIYREADEVEAMRAERQQKQDAMDMAATVKDLGAGAKSMGEAPQMDLIEGGMGAQ